MINITPKAAQKIHQLVLEKKSQQAKGLRLAIEKGGCAGLQYVMSLGESEKEDLILHSEEALVFIDSQSLEKLTGCTLDYEEGLTGSGFRIFNPQAARSCGCGTSFEPKKNNH